MKRKLLCVLVTQMAILILYGQDPNSFISLNNFLPPSPEAAALAKYGQVPVNYSSGLPSINIPIYEIKSRKLNLPVSLSYHSGGIKLDEIATTVGLGWSLNAGGVISRNVVGKPDEIGMRNSSFPYQYKNQNQLTVSYYGSGDTNFYYLNGMVNGLLDPQSDIYDITTPSFSGRFVYDIFTKQINYTPVDKQLKIVWNAVDTTYSMIDDNGVKYIFGEKEKTDNQFTTNITAWYATMVISADLTDTIFFKYKPAADFKDAFESQTYTLKIAPDYSQSPGADIGHCPPDKITNTIETHTSNITYRRKLIDSILFSTGNVKFVYASDRQDPGTERLTTIKINNKDSLIRQFVLSQSYFQSDPETGVPSKALKRLRFDSLQTKDPNGNADNAYSFEYNTQVKLPSYYKSENPFPIGKNTASDLWGYYNGHTTYLSSVLTSSIPSNYRTNLANFISGWIYSGGGTPYLNYYDNSSVDRFPDPNYTQAYMLRRINYPTGGFTQYEFENNKIANNGDNQDYTGGLRIRSMISYDGIKNPIVNTYAYGDSTGTGISISRVVPEDFSYSVTTVTGNPTQQIPMLAQCNRSNFMINANPITAINYYGGAPVFYNKVTEYVGFPGYNQGKTEYLFDYSPDSVYSNSYLTKYWNFSTDKGWARGSLLSSKVYKNSNGVYTLIKQTRNNYASLGQKQVKVGYIAECKFAFPGNISFDGYMDFRKSSNFSVFLPDYFDYADVVLAYGVKKLISSEDVTYVNTDSLVIKTEQYYESPYHLYQTKTKTTTSKSETTVAIIKYPQDKASIQNLDAAASTAIDGMITQNILTPVVEAENYRNANLSYRNRTDFINWNNQGRYFEQYKSQQILQNPLEKRIEYKSYDQRGNVAGASKVGDADISYIWDYNKTLLVAQTTNAADGETAYESFEAEGGSWNIPSSARETNLYLTGRKSYNLTNGNITKSGLTNGKSYVVSYWSQDANSKLVNGTGGSGKMGKRGWTLFEHIISSTSITISGSGLIDELRLYPIGSQMTSYTYVPLVGTTSINSPSHLLTFYEYDAFGRVLRLLDADGNIMQQFTYHYQSTSVTSPNWQPTGNSRQVSDGTSNSCLGEIEQKDLNNTSATYSQLRWVPGFLGSNPGNWQILSGQTRCKPGVTTGEQQQAYIDQSLCSSTYGKIKWVTTGITCACTPVVNCNGPDKKMINGCCETGVKIYTSYYHDNTLDRCYGTYHYEWSDDSWSQDYSDYVNGACPSDN